METLCFPLFFVDSFAVFTDSWAHCYRELQKITALPQREVNSILYRPEKSVTFFQGCGKTKRSGKTLTFCSSQKQGVQRPWFFHHISSRRVCAVTCATLGMCKVCTEAVHSLALETRKQKNAKTLPRFSGRRQKHVLLEVQYIQISSFLVAVRHSSNDQVNLLLGINLIHNVEHIQWVLILKQLYNIESWSNIIKWTMEIRLSPEDPWQMVFFSNFIKVECQALRAPGLAICLHIWSKHVELIHETIASIILTFSQSPFGSKTTHLRHCFCIEKPANICIYIYILFLHQRRAFTLPPPRQPAPLYPRLPWAIEENARQDHGCSLDTLKRSQLGHIPGHSGNLKPWSVHQVWYFSPFPSLLPLKKGSICPTTSMGG